MTSNNMATAPPPEPMSPILQRALQPALSTLDNDIFSEIDSQMFTPIDRAHLEQHVDEAQLEQHSDSAKDVEEVAQAQQQGGAPIEVPPVPGTRGPGHTPRGTTRVSSLPPRRPPSRTSQRYGTPRLRGDDMPPSKVRTELVPESRNSRGTRLSNKSFTQSNHSVHFVLNDEPTETASILFEAEHSMLNRYAKEESPDLHANTLTSDIQFVDEQPSSELQAVPVNRGVSATTRSTSLGFEVESMNDSAHKSAISRFSIEGGESTPKPVVQASHLSVVEDETVDKAAVAKVKDAEKTPINVVSWSESRRRAKKAEDARRERALRDRSLYMRARPWETNEPNPRSRRTSSECAALVLKQQQDEKMEEVEKRKHAMHTRPWRTKSSTPNKSRSTSGTKQKRWLTPPSARGGGATMAERPTPPSATEPKEVQMFNNEALADLVARPHYFSLSSDVRLGAAGPMSYMHPRSPVLGRVEDAKFVTSASVLKTPLEIVSEELEEWTHTANQKHNLQAIVCVMRARERMIVQLSNQLAAQSRVMKRLNTELYIARDEYMMRLGSDVAKLAPCTPRSRTMSPLPGRTSASPPPSITRLYTEQRHRAKDYYSMKMKEFGPRPVSVLSDNELSDSEKEAYAKDLQRWRVERAALRNEKARLVHYRRDLVFQMRRGSNIKDITITQPTSARGPLERAAAGTETAVDVNGYDRLMDIRMQAQRAVVEAANAKRVYEATLSIAATMKKRHNLSSAEVTSLKESRKKARELYTVSLQNLQQSAEEARPLLERANAQRARFEKAAMSLDESAEARLQYYSDTVLAVRIQADRAQALAEAAPGDEDRMLRSASTPRPGMSRAGTPRGSISGSMRPGTSPRIRGGNASNDDVFTRLTKRTSSTHNAAPVQGEARV
ncbi:hypothetical protein Q4I32_004541 [Leishmania shawi]|uniref:Uncharacterized protein n=1 Tax=Leishmania shawi TaxID=5680 RepID=A0AAW3BSE7_9TRYP